MSDNVIQASFAAGELSPSLFARVDFAKYRSGAATMRNFFVDYRSGASTRTGTEFIRAAQLGTPKVRLVRFQQSTKVTYVLEFGHGYIRFITNGASVVEPPQAIVSVTFGAQTTLTVSGAAYAAGQILFVTGSNVPQLNNRYFYINLVSGTTYTLLDATTGVAVNSSAWPAYTGGGVAQRVYTIGTPYTANQLSLLKFSQNANVMNITHPDHSPYKLTLFSATNWTLTPDVFGATVSPPGTINVSSSGAGSVFYKYTITSVDSNNQESVAGPVPVLTSGIDLRTTAGTNVISWSAAAGAVAYNIYGHPASYVGLASDTGGMGFIGSVDGSIFSFTDSNISADFAQTPPIHENPFAGVNPQVSSYFQQRLVFANGGGNLVQTFWMSKVGAPYNFDISNPIQANDAITGALVSLEVNEIKSMVPMPTGLILLTSNGAWIVNGGAGGVATQGGPITPASATATPQAYIGANDVPPIVVNYDILFVQSKGSVVRDLTFNIYQNIYTGNDISIASSHLFYGHQILEWAYAEEPFKIIWCVREDGVLLSLTLVKEQEMYGWARHDTLGNFESVCTVTEGQNDATYVAVRRPNPSVPNTSVLVIERLANREFPFGAEDAWCVDCATKTIANTPAATLLPIRVSDTVVAMVTNTPVFDATAVGQIIRVGGGIVKVTGFVGPSQLSGEVLQPITDVIPNDPQNRYKIADPGEWSIDKPFTKVFGLDQLEGQEVAVLADGGVVNGLMVHDGAITLPSPATKVVAGYGFQAQLQTMYLDLGQEVNSVQGKRKKVGALTVRCKDSRGLKAGRLFSTVTPIKELNRTTAMGFPAKLITADERIVMDPLWDVPGQICLQVDDPVPSTVLGVVPEVVIGDSQK
jgi:hypothetical protein